MSDSQQKEKWALPCCSPIYPGVVENLNSEWEEATTFGAFLIVAKGQTLVLRADNPQFGWVRSGVITSVYYERNGHAHANFFFRKRCLFAESNALAGISCVLTFQGVAPKSEIFLFDAKLLHSPEFY